MLLFDALARRVRKRFPGLFSAPADEVRRARSLVKLKSLLFYLLLSRRATPPASPARQTSGQIGSFVLRAASVRAAAQVAIDCVRVCVRVVHARHTKQLETRVARGSPASRVRCHERPVAVLHGGKLAECQQRLPTARTHARTYNEQGSGGGQESNVNLFAACARLFAQRACLLVSGAIARKRRPLVCVNDLFTHVCTPTQPVRKCTLATKSHNARIREEVEIVIRRVLVWSPARPFVCLFVII